MRLTEQQRAELERREWRPEVECGEFQTWVKIAGGCIASLYADGFFTFSGDPTLAAEFLAVAGYQPPSYRLVPEEVATAALPLIERQREWAFQFAAEYQQMLCDEDVDSKALVQRRETKIAEAWAWDTLAVALSRFQQNGSCCEVNSHDERG